MSLLWNLRNKLHNPFHVLKPISARLFATQKPSYNAHEFPDEPTSAYYDDLINEAGGSGDLEAVRYLLNKRAKDGCFTTTSTFKFITNTDTSLSSIDHLCRTLARLDSGFTRKSAYDSLVARLCKLRRVDESLRVVDAMVRGGYGLNVATFYPILSVVTRMKKMDEAWRIVELMRSLGVPPDLTAYNYILTAHCFNGDLEEARDLTRRMEEEGLGADSRAYDALVLGACRAGKVEGALLVLRKMEDEGVPVLYSTHAHVINALLKDGYTALGVKFVMVNGGRDEKLDTFSFGHLCSKLIDLNWFKEAELVLEEMLKRDLPIGNKLRNFYENLVTSKQ